MDNISILRLVIKESQKQFEIDNDIPTEKEAKTILDNMESLYSDLVEEDENI